MTWDEGRRVEDAEVYDGFRLSTPSFTLNIEQVRLAPRGRQLDVMATGVLLNETGDGGGSSVEAESISALLGRPHVRMIADRTVPGDLCTLGGTGAEVTVKDASFVRSVPDDEGGLLRRRDRVERIDLGQDISDAAGGCRIDLSISADGFERASSDRSGTSLNRMSIDLSAPGSVDTLIAGGVPEVRADLDLGGYEMRVAGGAPGIVMRDGMARLRAASKSLAPLLTSFLRTRTERLAPRLVSAYDALRKADVGVNFSANGAVLRLENLMPDPVIGDLSRADLTSIIGNYEGEASIDDAAARLLVSGDLTGLSKTTADLHLDLPGYQEGFVAGDGEFSLYGLNPPVRLDKLDITQEDRGFLRSFERFTGSTFSVFAALYSGPLSSEIPEGYRPAARTFLGRMNDFFSDSARGGTGRIRITTPTDLSLYETYQLGTRRPDLFPRLIRLEVMEE